MRNFLLAVLLLTSGISWADSPIPVGVDKVGDYDFKHSTLAKSVIDLGCSGTVIVKGSRYAYGVSAAHCATVGQSFGYDTLEGDSGNGTWIKVDRENDLALFKLNSFDSPEATPVIDPIPDKAMWLGAGYPSPNGGKQERKLMAYEADMDINDGSVKNRSEYSIKEGYVWGGDSGGAVFAVRTQAGVEGLVGVTSHRQGTKKLYASNHKALLSFVRECEPLMEVDCRDRWCQQWNTRNPKPGPEPKNVPGPPELRGQGQHDLPDNLDSDRDRALLIQRLLADVAALKKQNEELEKKLYEVSLKEGKAGPAGPKGDPGEDGRDGMKGDTGEAGPPGKDAEFDKATLITEFLAKIPPREVVLTKDGKIVDRASFDLTDPIVIEIRSITTQRKTKRE